MTLPPRGGSQLQPSWSPQTLSSVSSTQGDHWDLPGPQGTGQEGCAGSDSIEEKQRASTEMRTTTSWALKARRRHPGFTGAPALGPPYPSFQVGVPPQLWVPTRLMKVTPISVAPSAGGQKGVGTPSLTSIVCPGPMQNEYGKIGRPPRWWCPSAE